MTSVKPLTPLTTTLIFLNLRKNLRKIQITVGNEKVTQENSAKLLGMTLESSGDWNAHITGTGGLIPMLNKRLFLFKRLRNHLNDISVKKVAESIYIHICFSFINKAT